MSNRFKWAIGVSGVASLLAIAAPIYFYVADFNELQRSSDPADWGTFGDYFGGILNPILSLLTLIVTIIIATAISKIEKRNHDETVHSPVKPLFTIASKEFFSSDITNTGLTVEKDFYSYSPPQQPANPLDYLTNSFYLKVSNKGLGIATHINITYELDLELLLPLLTLANPQINVSGKIVIYDDQRKFMTVNIQSAHFNHFGTRKIWEKETYGLGIIDAGKKEKAVVPSHIMGAFQLHWLIQRLTNRAEQFPPFFVTFSYRNIHGKPLVAKFRVGLVHYHDYQRYLLFRVRQEQL